MPQFKRTLITSALPYANGPVHIGHLAGVYVPADIYARYLRLRHRPVLFIGGSDEHGVPVTIRAKKEGCPVQAVVDRYHELIKKSFEEFGISFDIYSRTTSAVHGQVASDFFRTLYDNGKFVEMESEQYYDEAEHQFLTDRNIRGECPRCHAPEAYGDQCEKCGATLSPEELINPYNAASGNPLVRRRTRHWYLPLQDYQPWLEQWILSEHREWRPNVYGQCKSWLDTGLKPRAVTRDLDWGIPVPVEGAEGKVLYVWFDAPIGYISNTKELCDARPELGSWETWWKDPETRLVHFIGKDNIVFHCIVFPAMLRAHGGYNLPDNVPSNEFLNLEGDKISTSRNHAVWLNEYLEDLPGRQDQLRYVLTANAPETKDNDFTWRDYQARNNNELVAILGNFVNRALQLAKKYYGGRVPEPCALTAYDLAMTAEYGTMRERIEQDIEQFKFRDAQREAMSLARLGNKYLADAEPWKVIKTDPDRVRTIINLSLQLTAALTAAFEPFLPHATARLRAMLRLEAIEWESIGSTGILAPGHQMGEPELLFDKIDDSLIQVQLDRLEAARRANEAAAATVPPVKPEVSYDDFQRLDIRVGRIVSCERVPKMKKLLKFAIDDGQGQRTIVSGIAQHYQPDELTGRQVLFIANLAPREFKNGLVSEGMLLSAEDYDHSLALARPDREVKPGSPVL